MNNLFEINLNIEEQARRYVVGSAIIAAVLFNSSVPAWFALLGCYPIFTAIMRFDPLNSCFRFAFDKLGKLQSSFVNNKLPV